MTVRVLVAAVAGAFLMVTGCSHPAAVDPNHAACQQWSAAYKSTTDALNAYSGSGADPKVEAAIANEKAVISAALPNTTGNVHQSLSDVLTAYAQLSGSDGKALGTAEYVVGVACNGI